MLTKYYLYGIFLIVLLLGKYVGLALNMGIKFPKKMEKNIILAGAALTVFAIILGFCVKTANHGTDVSLSRAAASEPQITNYTVCEINPDLIQCIEAK